MTGIDRYRLKPFAVNNAFRNIDLFTKANFEKTLQKSRKTDGILLAIIPIGN